VLLHSLATVHNLATVVLSARPLHSALRSSPLCTKQVDTLEMYMCIAMQMLLVDCLRSCFAPQVAV
jgi:hypothetical protein